MMTRAKRIARVLWTTVKRLAMALGAVIVLGIGVSVGVILRSGDADFEYTPPVTLINDVTQMNPTHVARVLTPTSVEEVAAALRETTGPVSIGGSRFSQGGQVSYPDSVHLDMRRFNRVLNLDVQTKRAFSEEDGNDQPERLPSRRIVTKQRFARLDDPRDGARHLRVVSPRREQ